MLANKFISIEVNNCVIFENNAMCSVSQQDDNTLKLQVV